MKTKFDILMACRVIHLCYFTSAYPHLVCGPCFCDSGSPIAKLYAQEPQQTSTLTFGLKLSTDSGNSTLDLIQKWSNTFAKFAKHIKN